MNVFPKSRTKFRPAWNETNVRRFGSPALYSGLLLAFCAISHFAILSNDVFPLRWQAEHLSLHEPATFYNGFFPIGYPLLERVAGITGDPILTMMLVQIVVAMVYVVLARSLMEKLVGRESAFAALPLILFGPEILRNVLSATPDFLAGFCVLVAFGLLEMRGTNGANRSTRNAGWNIFYAGIALGLGYLLRTHVIVLVLAIALALAIIERPGVRSCLLLLAGTVPFVAAQGLVQVWSGHGFFENAQAFNVWRMMHGSNWSNPPMLRGMSALDVARSDPRRFVSAWWDQIVPHWYYIVPCLLACLLMLRRGRFRSDRGFAALLLGAILYLVVSAFGGSPRNVIVVVPVVAAAVMFVIEPGLRRLRRFVRKPAYAMGIIFWIAGAIGTLVLSFHAARRVSDYRQVENTLGVRRSEDAQHIFTDDFDLYFPDLHYATPRTSGGWPELGLPSFASRFPHIPDSTAAVLHAALAREGIRWAIFRSPPYDERGYAGVKGDSVLFHLTYETPLHHIYRVE